jgi:hypothetical protein
LALNTETRISNLMHKSNPLCVQEKYIVDYEGKQDELIGSPLDPPFLARQYLTEILKIMRRKKQGQESPLMNRNYWGRSRMKMKVHCKKRLTIFPSPTGMSLTKLSLARNNIIIPGQREFG